MGLKATAMQVCLFDAVAAPFKARSLSPQVVGSITGRRPAPRLSRIEAGLTHRPLMTLEFVLTRLFRGLTILRISNEIRGTRGLSGPLRSNPALIRDPGWRGDRFILRHVGIPAVIGVVGVIVRNAYPIIGRVIIRQSREIKAEPQAAPTPAPRPPLAASPSVVTTAPSITAPESAIAAVKPATVAAVKPAANVAAGSAVLRECRRASGQQGNTCTHREGQ